MANAASAAMVTRQETLVDRSCRRLMVQALRVAPHDSMAAAAKIQNGNEAASAEKLSWSVTSYATHPAKMATAPSRLRPFQKARTKAASTSKHAARPTNPAAAPTSTDPAWVLSICARPRLVASKPG